jgi:hypothetical protein
MKFIIHDEQSAIDVDESFWNRAFNYASRELQIEYHCAEIDCFFIPLNMERAVKFKAFTLGSTGLTDLGAMFYVVTEDFLTDGSMVKTFFHEMTHVRQLLMRDLIPKSRSIVWKGEKWDKREYAFAPWEKEANTFSAKSYDTFLRREVTRLMQDENIHAYHPSVRALRRMFPQDDVFRLTQELHRERESRAFIAPPRITSPVSGLFFWDWLTVGANTDNRRGEGG